MKLAAHASAVLFVSGALSGCMSFSSVRSAEVNPGLSARVEATVASPPGQGAAWFYTLTPLSSTIPPAVELGLEFGVLTDDGHAYSLGASVNGFYPQLDGYVALHAGEQSASGIGVRVSVPVRGWGWSSHRVYGRYDRVLGPRTKLLYNPAVGLHIGNSPNGQNPGYMLMLAQGIGVPFEGRNITFIPSLTLVLGTGHRGSWGDVISFTTRFVTVSGSLTLHRARER